MLVAGPEPKKDIIEIIVQFEFLTTSSFETFKNQQTLFQDKCYQYMKANGPADSSQKNWTKLVQQDLLKHLQKESPKLHIETMHRNGIHPALITLGLNTKLVCLRGLKGDKSRSSPCGVLL